MEVQRGESQERIEEDVFMEREQDALSLIHISVKILIVKEETQGFSSSFFSESAFQLICAQNNISKSNKER